MLISYAVLITLEESTQSKGRKLNAVVNGFRIFGASLTITLMLHKHTNLIECIRRMQSFDNNMKALGVESSYATHNVFVIFACTFIIVSQLCTTIMYWFLKRSIYLATCYFLSKGYQFIIIGIVVVYLNYFCFILGRKLHFLMKLTKSLTKHNKDPLKLLIMISEMYDDVFQTAKHINQMVSVPVLILTIGDILGGMITLYLMYHKEDNVVDEVSLGLHALQIICTLLPPMYIKKTVRYSKKYIALFNAFAILAQKNCQNFNRMRNLLQRSKISKSGVYQIGNIIFCDRRLYCRGIRFCTRRYNNILN